MTRPTATAGPRDVPRLTSDHIRAIDARLRVARDTIFGSGYLTDQPWSLLMDIDWASRNGSPRPYSAHIGFSPSLGLVTLTRFEQDGLVERRVDPADPENELVVLTARGRRILDDLFETVALQFN